MGKRSPILGYNHNVRYRGLIFHVQTEDSGIASPHLFTHLFHHGVIVSTRKLVYDAGSAEDSIKSLMQAQHKAVLKDLRRGHFDDKIDSYLGGTPGLLPRGGVNLAILSTGGAAAKTDTNPGYHDFVSYTHVGTQTCDFSSNTQCSPYPADFLAANNNTLPNAPGCPDADAADAP